MKTLAMCAAGLELLEIPAWVLDPDRLRVIWANDLAVDLWNAADRPALLARDFSADISASMRARVDRQAAEARAGRAVVEQTTFYPLGRPVSVVTHVSGIRLDDDRVGLLIQVTSRDDVAPDADLLRGVEALRHCTMMVATVDLEGAILMRNPAALRAFGDAPWRAWFKDPAAAAALLRDATDGESAEAELLARTAAGERLHLVQARLVRDPVTGQRVLLIQQMDETARWQAEQDALSRARIIAEQAETILALSAPILEIGDRRLAVPVIGALDRERVAEILRRLLPAIVERGATAVSLDLTGAGHLDAESAAQLAMIARAVRLLGARMILSGIPPQAARLLAAEGPGLADVLVRRTLRDALQS